jgi:hypothetical protein
MQQDQNCMTEPLTHHVVVLTLAKHKDGSWITLLIEALREQDDETVLITVLTLESILDGSSHQQLAVGERSHSVIPDTTTVLVNRVSDAADPELVKVCTAVLALVTSCRGAGGRAMMIPVVNGAAAYALCTNKWCHHLLFQQAGLSIPRTLKFFRPEPAAIEKAMEEWEDDKVQHFLLKPNAGGFGAGMVECQRGRRIVGVDQGVSNDGVLLLQEYMEAPLVYRVWFLDGRILCAVVRRNEKASFNGCVASNKEYETYDVPDDVREEIEGQLLPLLPEDAHTGSVEFLYCGERRFYFDLNLLSTLPLEHADAWAQLASSILAKSTNGQQSRQAGVA